MTQVIQAIYENGVLRPLGEIHLSEHQQVRLVIDGTSNEGASNSSIALGEDPLEGYRVSLGIPDLSEKFNEYKMADR
jgi:predicted DNA-binding antitoxin AbrB/MazE fold protein